MNAWKTLDSLKSYKDNMSATINTVNISALAPIPKSINEDVVVGKDILELLAGSMYLDPLNVYREYIQNAADAIDQAREAGLNFQEEAGVQIYFDQAERSIRIRDNGISIPFSDFVQRIVTIGASQKRGKQLRGFRGVGRLSGLGYCQELIFRGRAEGNAKVTEIRWNGRLLREKYRDQHYHGTLSDLVKEVTTVTLLSSQGFPNRFFEVELRKIARLKNDVLLNEKVVRNYLSQIAPVPFGDFVYASQIEDSLKKYGIKSPIRVELMDGNGPITHRIKDKISFSEQISDPISKVDFIELTGPEGEVIAYGWIAHHSYLGSIPKGLGLGGIRLRSGNIQVGDETITSSLFPETRFSGWAIGDIHILSPKILPNGRRDEFEPSTAYTHLQSELVIKARNISHLIREKSAQRVKLRSIDQKIKIVQSWVGLNSEKNLPLILSEVLKDLSLDQIEQTRKELGKLNHDDLNRQNLESTLKIAETSVNSVLSKNINQQTHTSLNIEMKKPIAAALKTIISNAKTPEAGIKLSLEVLKAIELENI